MKIFAANSTGNQTPDARQAEAIFTLSAIVLLLVSIAVYWFGKSLDERDLLYVALSLLIAQINLRSWRSFAELCVQKIVSNSSETGATSPKMLELVTLKGMAFALLLALIIAGGLRAVEIAALCLVLYLLCGLLGLGILRRRINRGAQK